jgi:hypothetical protein
MIIYACYILIYTLVSIDICRANDHVRQTITTISTIAFLFSFNLNCMLLVAYLMAKSQMHLCPSEYSKLLQLKRHGYLKTDKF